MEKRGKRFRQWSPQWHDGEEKGELAWYCCILKGSRQGYYQYLVRQKRPWKCQGLAEAMLAIHEEDVFNMYQTLVLKQPEGGVIPSEWTVYRTMKKLGLVHRPK